MSWFGLGPASQSKQVKACALIGLHMMAEENAWRSDSGSFASSGSSCEDNVGNGKRSLGLFWMLGTVCVYAQPGRNGMSQGDTGRMKKESMVLNLPCSPGHAVPGIIRS